MRRRLRDIREQSRNIDSIRTIRGAIEYILWYFDNTNSAESSGTTFGSCVMTIDVEDTITVGSALYVRVVGDTFG